MDSVSSPIMLTSLLVWGYVAAIRAQDHRQVFGTQDRCSDQVSRYTKHGPLYHFRRERDGKRECC